MSVCGKSQVDDFAGQSITHLLSLEDPSVPKETPDWFRGVHHQLHFHDVDSAEFARELQERAVTEEQVREILHFGASCLSHASGQPAHLLVHCFAGISRSTAACYAIVAQALGQGREAEALEFVARIRPEAMPNELVVRHADKLLARGGAMLRELALRRERYFQALEEWGGKLVPGNSASMEEEDGP